MNINSYVRHHRRIKITTFNCQFCERTFTTLKSVRSHENFHNPDHIKKFEASRCVKARGEDSGSRKMKRRLETEYISNPIRCAECKEALRYSKRNYKFCSRSCMGTFNNRLRLSNGYSQPATYSDKQRIRDEKIREDKRTQYMSSPKKCDVCSSILPYDIRHRKTCSQECYGVLNLENSRKGGLKSAQKMTRRSKHEIEFYELCVSYFDKVEHNVNMFDGWDADVLIHDLKLAVSWNGDWHYVEMPFSKQSLLQVQTRDAYRDKKINENGWKHHIIEDSTANPTTPEIEFARLLKMIGCP